MDTKADCRERLLLAWADRQWRRKHLEMGRREPANFDVSYHYWYLICVSHPLHDRGSHSQTVKQWKQVVLYCCTGLQLLLPWIWEHNDSVVPWAAMWQWHDLYLSALLSCLLSSMWQWHDLYLCIAILSVEFYLQKMETRPAWQLEPWSWGRGGLCRADPWRQLERFLLHWPDWFRLWKGHWE